MVMIIAENGYFKDELGRTHLLRGVNLGGSTKVPYLPNGATYQPAHFWDWKGVSFVGRPFPLKEADEHFKRLKTWGMTFLRFLVTWEAIEHDAPGEYDEAYLDYVRAVLVKANEYGITCFIDPHQDVWSRWTGGDGAPAWTLDLLGFDIPNLHNVGATLTHQTHGDPFPQMIWPSNYSKLATATMFTLFFAGNEFAPKTRIEGIPAQEYLQSHFINAMKQVAECVKDLPNVVGFDSLNEPSGGYIGHPLESLGERMMTSGATPTSFQGMMAASGYTIEVDNWGMSLGNNSIIGKVTLNPNKINVWRNGYECVWKQNGVWTDADGEPQLLRPNHFRRADGQPIDVVNEYMKPFMIRYGKAIREVMPHAILFLEGAPGGTHPHWSNEDPVNCANASHWYDVMTLYYKRFFREKTLDWGKREIVEGADKVQATFNSQLAVHKRHAIEHMNGMPTVIGEFGLPFDLDKKRAYSDHNYSEHIEALSMYYEAMDANLLSCTLWNYTADNTNARGDGWNDEDLSIFSRDQQNNPQDIHSGGRAIEGFLRPYAMKVQGEPIYMHFDRETKIFVFTYRANSGIQALTEIFIPETIYGQNYQIEVPEEVDIVQDFDQQLLQLFSPVDGEITVRVAKK
jgi:hypothetical protein